MTSRTVPRVVRVIVAVAALLAGVGPAIALAAAWRPADASWRVSVHAVPASHSSALGVAHVQRRPAGRAGRIGPARGGGRTAPRSTAALHARPPATVAASIVTHARRGDGRRSVASSARPHGQAYAPRAPPIG